VDRDAFIVRFVSSHLCDQSVPVSPGELERLVLEDELAEEGDGEGGDLGRGRGGRDWSEERSWRCRNSPWRQFPPWHQISPWRQISLGTQSSLACSPPPHATRSATWPPRMQTAEKGASWEGALHPEASSCALALIPTPTRHHLAACPQSHATCSNTPTPRLTGWRHLAGWREPIGDIQILPMHTTKSPTYLTPQPSHYTLFPISNPAHTALPIPCPHPPPANHYVYPPAPTHTS
jgi:hypothetical protein